MEMSAVGQWLESLALGQYAELFAANRVELDVLPDLTESDLEKLGIPLGDRKRLLRAIAARAAAPEPASPQGTVPSPAEARVERRQVTILFVDLTGYTRLTSTLGAEATHELVQRFYQRVTGIVRNYSGTVERHIGDAIMAVFGLPVAHGNDPERALRAALAIHEAMPVLSGEVGHALSVHAGVASGQVVASHAGAGSDFSTVGDAVNLGARLVGLAQPGETILSGAVHRAVADLCSAESIGEVSVKGFDEPVGVWRVLGLKQTRAPEQRTPLIGRSVELRQFRALCEACREERAGQIILVRGEAGIGKTRLIEEFEAAAGTIGFASHKGLTLDFGLGRSQDPVGRIVASLLGYQTSGDVEARSAVLEAATAEGLVNGDEAMFAADLLDVPLPQELQAVYQGMDSTARAQRRREFVARLLQRAAGRAPQLVVVEDIHWADQPLLETLAETGAAIEGHSIVLVLTTRPDADPVGATWRSRVGPRVGMLTLDLRPLRETEALELARTLGLGETMLTNCVQRAEGNPLFLEQLLRSAVAGDQETLPGSVQSIVLSRLDRLQPRDRQAIQAASVLGQYFSLPLLRHLIGDAGYQCDALISGNLVRRMGEELLFAHALIWEGTYASLLSERKRQWHRAAAAWYANGEPALATEHYERAEDPQAPRAYLDAARAERALQHTERTIRLLERGLRLAIEPGDRIELLTDLGELLSTIGRPLEAITAFESLLELATDDRQRCRAKIGIASGLRMLDRQPEAFALLDEAEALAGPAFDAERAQLHYLRGSLYFPIGNVQGSFAEQTRALEHARACGSIELQLRALSGLADAHYGAGRIVSAHRCFRECVEMSREHRFGQIEAANLPMVAFAALLMGKLDEVQETSRAAVTLAQRMANRRAEIVAHHGCAIAHLEQGDVGLARPHGQAAVDLSRAIGARRFDPESMLLVAGCLFYDGDRVGATAMMREALAIAREHISYCGPMILGTLARATPDPEERRRCLEEGEQILDAGSPAHNHLFFYREAIDAALDVQDWSAALRYADLLEDQFREEPLAFADFVVARAHALAAAGQGRRDPALRSQLHRLAAAARKSRHARLLPALEAAAAAPGWEPDELSA
jgi:class 3 adenylate cyclase/tetratricopeptide (TPR) repeat protein